VAEGVADQPRRVAILGAPLDLGAARRGVDMGPSAIRLSGLSERLESLGVSVEDWGNVAAEIPEVASEDDERAGRPDPLAAPSSISNPRSNRRADSIS
jgi:arginase family enzyme